MSDGVLLCPTLVPMAGGSAPRRGRDVSRLDVIPEAALAWKAGRLTYAGVASDLPDLGGSTAHRVDGAVLPGFVDCHTHVPFFGWRADEFQARLAGRSYRDLHGGGGIYRSARLLAGASDEDVMGFCRPLLREMVEHGTTAVELKTGYGLSVDGELHQARLARRLAAEGPQVASVTLLACHAVPPGVTREQWVARVCAELIPRAANEGLVDQVDVYVEDIAFSPEDVRRVAEAARAHGLPLRTHADQLGASGAAEVSAEVGARSADHLNHVSGDGIAALGAGATAAVLLPASTLVLGAKAPPAVDLVSAGGILALATDFNPGTSPCVSMPEVISLAAALYRLPIGTSLAATTINAAWVLGLEGSTGSLETGKRADFIVIDQEDPAMIAYRPGHNPVAETWIGGARVYRRP